MYKLNITYNVTYILNLNYIVNIKHFMLYKILNSLRIRSQVNCWKLNGWFYFTAKFLLDIWNDTVSPILFKECGLETGIYLVTYGIFQGRLLHFR